MSNSAQNSTETTEELTATEILQLGVLIIKSRTDEEAKEQIKKIHATVP
ncbi:hypothetical protein [Brevibacillus laterosporus]|nr:hypothetical protein [Brevibacillus laterosporus]MED1909789.1 hypothetical protein [Brevibacillus laterosporus]